MKTRYKKSLVLLFIQFYPIIFFGQNWQTYNTFNSASPFDTYHAMTADTSGSPWFVRLGGTSGGKTIHFDTQTNWTVFNNTYTSGTSTFTFDLRSIKADKRNTMWGVGLDNKAYSLKEGTFTRYTSTSTGINAMTNVYGAEIAVDNYNNKWFATYLGLVKYNDTSFTLYDTINSALPSSPIYKVVSDKQNNIWIYCPNSGNPLLVKYDGFSWQSFSVPIPPSVLPWQVIIDSINNIWITTNNGASSELLKFDGVTWNSYTTSNSAIPTSSFGKGSIDVDNQNNLWLAYFGGLSKFDGTNWFNYDSTQGYPCSSSAGLVVIDKFNNKWGLTSQEVFVFNENGIVGIEEKTNANFFIYPNPASSTITIESKMYPMQSIKIVDVLGREVYYLQTQNNKTEIDISHLPSGIYILQLQSKSGIVSKKFVKE
jgi:ligand-binding sensor domain-containing protein